ncbi:MAG: hypothetical protein PHD54_02225 [Desulfuromonadaceae bacterium]|nr:hypothetical protein [Desulfuromonadaceae bacterium]
MIPTIFRLKVRFALIVLTLMLPALPAQGIVFMWRDSAGIVHYTNKEHEIPARYKARAKPLYPEAGDSAPGQSSSQNSNQIANQSGQKEPASVIAPAPINTSTVNAARKTRKPRVRSSEEE